MPAVCAPPRSTRTPLDMWLDGQKAPQDGHLTILQIGASDGTREDPLRRYFADPPIPVRAVLVEPLPEAFGALKRLYRDRADITTVNAAVDRQAGHRTIYTIAPDCPYRADQLSSFLREHLLRNGVKARHIREIETRTISLPMLLEESGLSGVDLLQIDTEGFDHELVAMALELPENLRPVVINFEHNHVPPNRIAPLFDSLRVAGYDWMNCDWDTFCLVRSERTWCRAFS